MAAAVVVTVVTGVDYVIRARTLRRTSPRAQAKRAVGRPAPVPSRRPPGTGAERPPQTPERTAAPPRRRRPGRGAVDPAAPEPPA